MIGPPARAWPDRAFAWCQRCDWPINVGQPYETVSGGIDSGAGFNHRHCPPRLVVIRGLSQQVAVEGTLQSRRDRGLL